MVFTLKIDKIIDAIFATDTSFFTLKIDNNRSNPTNACACMCVYVCVCCVCVCCVCVYILPSLEESNTQRNRKIAVLGAGAGGRARANPRALTPTRPRVRVPALSVLTPGCVRRRGCSRTPSVNRARAPRAPVPRQSADPFFFPPR